jgi:hypothetical protein
MPLFKGAPHLSRVASSCSLSWPFLLRIHPSEHSHLSHSFYLIDSSFRENWEHPSALLWVIASRGTWWLCFAADFACYSWWLLPPRRLGAARIIERRKVLVSGSDRGDCEGFLTFPRRRAKRYSSRLLMACVILILCWLCGTRLRVRRVMSISAWTSKWVNRHNRN